VPPYVEDTGEVNWLVGDAMCMEVPIPVISQAVMQLFSSRDDRKNWARAIAMMRHGFGGHAYGADAATRQERREGRVVSIAETNSRCREVLALISRMSELAVSTGARESAPAVSPAGP